jgi:hypothetical protein
VHTVTLADENVEPLDFDRLAPMDLVGLTGMHVQRRRMHEILAELKRRGVFTVVGGTWVSAQEEDFGDLADVVFVGEAEDTWPLFLREWPQGRHARRYEQAERTDMTRVPAPRLDLLPMHRYAVGSVQCSRGCPFRCEFCDIIVTFGRLDPDGEEKTGTNVIPLRMEPWQPRASSARRTSPAGSCCRSRGGSATRWRGRCWASGWSCPSLRWVTDRTGTFRAAVRLGDMPGIPCGSACCSTTSPSAGRMERGHAPQAPLVRP